MTCSRIAIIFPGQGAQYAGMGKDLYDSQDRLRIFFDGLCGCLDFDLKKICFEGPEDLLNRTDYSQPAIYAISMMCLMYLEDRCPRQMAVLTAGLSLGEYSAITFARSISPEEGMSLVALRGKLMHEAGTQAPGSMVCVIGLEEPKVAEFCRNFTGDDYVCVANINCPGQVVVSGTKEGILKFSKAVLEVGARQVIPLAVSGAFHSRLMNYAVEKFSLVLDKIDFKNPEIPVISNVTADYVRDKREFPGLLARQLSNPVLWQSSMQKAMSEDVDLFIEVGPGNVLKGLMKRIDRKRAVINIERLNDLQAFAECIK